MTTLGNYLSPSTLEEVFEVVAGGRATILAGGTDLLPRWSKGLLERPQTVVDLKKIDDLQGVSHSSGQVSIGACTPMYALETNQVILSKAPVLAQAAGHIACPQVRHRATIGGNLCNASPAADTAIPLILLDAVLELSSIKGKGVTSREVPVSDFFRGPGATVLKPGEVLTHIRFQPPLEGTYIAWEKFGTRPSMEIAVASVGVALRIENQVITQARVGYGSVAPVPLRGAQAETALMGSPLSAEVIKKCEAAARNEIKPITDVRASEEYRREVVGVLLRRMLQSAQSD